MDQWLAERSGLKSIIEELPAYRWYLKPRWRMEPPREDYKVKK